MWLDPSIYLMFGRFTMNEKNYSKVPCIWERLAQPVFPLTDGKTGEKYDPATSSIRKIFVFMWKRITMWTEMEKEILWKLLSRYQEVQ